MDRGSAQDGPTGLRDAVEAGVRIAYGSDAVVFPHSSGTGQLVVASGTTLIDAFCSATEGVIQPGAESVERTSGDARPGCS